MVRKNYKKRSAVLILFILTLFITGIFAAMSANESVDNIFTVGNVDISLDEPNWNSYVTDGVLSNIVPMQKIQKDPTITNTGTNDAYVYVMVEVPKAYKTNIVIDGVETEKKHYQLFDYAINEDWKLIASKTGDNDEAYNYYVYAYENPLKNGDKAVAFDEITFANVTSELKHYLTGEDIADLNVKVTGYAIQSDFYGNEASDAATAWELYVNQNNWDWPANPYEGTLADLENKHKFEYYSKFSLAVTDVNNDEIGVNADVDRPDAVAGIYVEEGEAPTVVLFKDAEETSKVILAADMNINLAGYTLKFTESNVAFDTVNTNGNKIFIDGRVGESTLLTVMTGTNKSPYALQIRAGNTIDVIGGKFITQSQSTISLGALVLGNLNMDGAYLENTSVSGQTRSINCSAGGYAKIKNTSFLSNSTQNQTSGLVAAGGVIEAENCHITSKALTQSSGMSTTSDGKLIANNCKVSTYSQNGPSFAVLGNDGSINVSFSTLKSKSDNSNVNTVQFGYDQGNNYIGTGTINNCIIESNAKLQSMGVAVCPYSSAEISNNTIKTNSSNGKSRGVSVGADASSNIIKCNITSESPYLSNDDSYNCSGIFIDNAGVATIQNCNVKGLNSGICNSGNLYVDGGTYQGWGHGGIYFSGSDNNAYVKNANIGQWDYDGEYDTAGMTGGNNGAAMYIGGSSDAQNINVYMDNCTLTALRQVIVLRGTSSEKNNSLYISNSTINIHDIRIDNSTHKLYIGRGCNFDVNSVVSNQSVVTQTDEVYTFDMPTE